MTKKRVVSKREAMKVIYGADNIIEPVFKMRAVSLVVRGCKIHKRARLVELFRNFELAKKALVDGINEIERSFAERSIPSNS